MCVCVRVCVCLHTCTYSAAPYNMDCNSTNTDIIWVCMAPNFFNKVKMLCLSMPKCANYLVKVIDIRQINMYM